MLGYLGDKQPAKKVKCNIMVESVTFEPESLPALAQFLKENNNKYHEIWIIITNKKTANIQPVSFNQIITEAVKQGLIDSRIKKIDEKKYMIRLTKKIKT